MESRGQRRRKRGSTDKAGRRHGGGRKRQGGASRVPTESQKESGKREWKDADKATNENEGKKSELIIHEQGTPSAI